MKTLTQQDVEFSIECMPEEVEIEGNASAIDEDTDNATNRWIYEQLESGNEWAWCTVKVTAEWNGIEGSDYLGCCSYESEKDFTQPGGYYDDMKAQALDMLNEEIARLHSIVCD